MKNKSLPTESDIHQDLLNLILAPRSDERRKIIIFKQKYVRMAEFLSNILLSPKEISLIIFSIKKNLPALAKCMLDFLVEINDRSALDSKNNFEDFVDKINNLKDLSDNNILHLACENGYLKILDQVVNLMFDINKRNIHGQTPLFLAVKAGHLKIVERLLARGADVTLADFRQETCLHLAAFNGDLPCVKRLIEENADIKSQNIMSETPLHHAIEREHIHLFEMLIVADAYETNHLFLQYACLNFRFESANKLIDLGVRTESTQKKNQTLLHILAFLPNHPCRDKFSETKFIQNLLKNTLIDLNAQDEKGNTALHLAVIYNNIDLSIELIKARANVNIENNNHETFLMLVIIKLPRPEYLIDLLYSAKADLDGNNSYYRPLHVAALNGKYKAFRALLRYGADINLPNDQGETALHCAVRYGYVEILVELIKCGASINLQDINGQTALHFAAKYQKPEFVKMLINFSVCIEVNLVDNQGRTALHLAALTNNSGMICSLKAAGANVDLQDNEGKKAEDLLKNQNSSKTYASKIEFPEFFSMFHHQFIPTTDKNKLKTPTLDF